MRVDLIQKLDTLYKAFKAEDYYIDFKLKDRQSEFLIVIDIRKEDIADIIKSCLKVRRIEGG